MHHEIKDAELEKIFANKSKITSKTVVILDQIITDNAPTIWYPKKLKGPPLKIPLKLLKPSLISFSPNNPTAISPQIPPKKCTGTADTGSSIFSFVNNRVPEIIHYT